MENGESMELAERQTVELIGRGWTSKLAEDLLGV